ncbi:hypothetical protein AGOR_G00189660 [Albula goreensis]|uniref:GB1/RHD3-type G domain-containing protein n=1 Tax=Albula goreensis TaxID=1534307 RepID=A0A8T3CSQ5_9TELE|nr:hypothetical protein AGOR_G00189660 [Albula goreensis]
MCTRERIEKEMMASEDPIWLAECSAMGEVRVNREALRALGHVSRPLRVVSIFGPRQSGKSFLLNLLAGSPVFTVSSSDFPKDPRICMWISPDEDSPEPRLVLLDTEVFEEDLEMEGNASCPMFTLSLLLSSVFLYNTRGPVTLDKLDQLLHVTMLTNQVSFPPINGSDESPLPEFVWCVRDVDLEIDMGDVELLPADFLDSVLNDIKDQHSPASTICKLFPRNRMKMSSSKVHPDHGAVSGKELGDILEQFADSLSRGSCIQLDSRALGAFMVEDDQDLASPMDLDIPTKKQRTMEETMTPRGSCTRVLRGDMAETATPLGGSVSEAHRVKVETEMPLGSGRHDAYSHSHTAPSATWREGRALAEGGPVDMKKPVCLIENMKTGELQVNQEALNILGSIRQPVVVVSIVGMYRTGKSYLMNRLAGKDTGFSLGSTIQSETKGIWMWCVPHPCKNDHTLVLLDTEGLGDVEKGDQKNDNWIFALAVLLSSTFVYNSMGTINNEAVMSLHYVTELTEHIKVKSSQEKEEDTSSEYVRFFPAFVWAVRDFSLELEINGNPVTADQYLENSLKLKQGHSKAVAISNDARECIRNYFPCRKCFVFDRPASKENLKSLEKLKQSDLHPDFVKQASDFCNYIFNCSKEKTIKGGITVTGSLLANLAVTYVDAIRSGRIPCLENAVLALSQIENSTAVEEAHALYKTLLGELLQLHTETQEELSSIHEVCLKEALEFYMKRSFKDEDQAYQRGLMDRVKAVYEAKCQENDSISQNHCVALLMQLEDDMDTEESYMKPGGYNQYRASLDDLIQSYRNTPGKGVKAEQALEEFLKEKNERSKIILMADKSLSAQQRQFQEEQARAEMERHRAEAAREHQRALERRLEDMERARKENQRQLEDKMAREQRAAQEEHERVLNQKLREQRALLQEGFDDRTRQLEVQIQNLQRTNESQQRSRRSRGGGCVLS